MREEPVLRWTRGGEMETKRGAPGAAFVLALAAPLDVSRGGARHALGNRPGAHLVRFRVRSSSENVSRDARIRLPSRLAVG